MIALMIFYKKLEGIQNPEVMGTLLPSNFSQINRSDAFKYLIFLNFKNHGTAKRLVCADGTMKTR